MSRFNAWILIVLSLLCTNCNCSMDAKMRKIREEVKEMYVETFDNYMKYAFPMDELKPLSCSGQKSLGKYSLCFLRVLSLNSF